MFGTAPGHRHLIRQLRQTHQRIAFELSQQHLPLNRVKPLHAAQGFKIPGGADMSAQFEDVAATI